MIEKAMNSEIVSGKNDANQAQKLGLALSGGGFRASLFHIGVLMALAEMGLLHKIEVISTVSGGSIIGAMYYLRLKKLLKDFADANVLPNDPNPLQQGCYISLVKKMKLDFIKGVSRNLRTRVFSNLKDNLKMTLPSYSSSDRISQLYDKYFYGNRKILLRDLKIIPKGEVDDYHSEEVNHRRTYKVPILVISATTLNTGHNWRFGAKNMGEPPVKGLWAQDVDKNMRLRRPINWEVAGSHQADFQLSSAVAASACVPGLLHPMSISKMYEPMSFDGKIRKIRVQLVDGRVNDSLGLANLTDYQCTTFVVSDASGNLADIADPSTSNTRVLDRTNSILMERVRGEELSSLKKMYPGKVAYVHLRKGIPAREANYINRDGNLETKNFSSPNQLETSKVFEVDESVQYRLSCIRTDLDSFSEIEAEALIADARLMSRHHIPRSLDIETPPEGKKTIIEERIEELLKNPTNRFLYHLDVAAKKGSKAVKLWPWLTIPIGVVIFGVIVTFSESLNEIIQMVSETFFDGTLSFVVDNPATSISTPVLGYPLVKFLLTLKKITEWIEKATTKVKGTMSYPNLLVTRALPAILKWPVVWFRLIVFDSLFKSAGKISRLK